MSNTPELQALIDRMCGFDANQSFDGYPSMTCEDEGLIKAAVDANEADMRAYEQSKGEPLDNNRDPLQYLCYIASEVCKTAEQFDNARRFIDQYIATMWACNMQEGSNPVYEERAEADGDYSLL